jgi:hypothetical protein
VLYRSLLKDDELALEAYNHAYERAGNSYGWLSLSSTLGSASILHQQGKTEAAQKVMARYDRTQLLEMPAVWGDKLRALNEQIAEKLSGALLIIANHGASDYQIVLPVGYPSPEIGADMAQVARLMQTAFKANGAELAVVSEAARDTAKPAIYLGDTAFARSHGIDVRELAGWSYVHRAVGRDIIITGRDETAPGRNMKGASRSSFDRIGTAKAVTDFLQTHVGVRFLFPDNGPRLSICRCGGSRLRQTSMSRKRPCWTTTSPGHRWSAFIIWRKIGFRRLTRCLEDTPGIARFLARRRTSTRIPSGLRCSEGNAYAPEVRGKFSSAPPIQECRRCFTRTS